MIRHWDKWDEGKRSHLFVADAKTGEAKDLTPRLDVNTPPGPFGGSNDYAFSPDGKELAFTAEPLKDPAWSTNTDIWTVPVAGGEPKNLTEDNPGADAQPAYSPDGNYLAWLSQARAGFESDQWVLKIRPRKPETGADDRVDRASRPARAVVRLGQGREGIAVSDRFHRRSRGHLPREDLGVGCPRHRAATCSSVPSKESRRAGQAGA